MKNTLFLKAVIVLINLSLFLNLEAQIDLSITHQGYNRSFRVYIPPGYLPTQPVPLVLVFHGGGTGGALECQTRTKFNLIGDTAKFITIFPQSHIQGEWADTRGNRADIVGIDDVGFTAKMITMVESLYNIDKDRIYVAGLSTGGFFCQRLALQSNHRIAAFASVAASLTTSLMASFPTTRKIPILYMNGTADPRQPYYGGKHLIPPGIGDYINTDTAASYWASFNHTTNTPAIINYPNTNIADNSTVTKITYSPGQNCSEVVLYRINNGGHTWPGAVNPAALGTVNSDINASHEIWTFFRRHKLECTGVDAGKNLITLIDNLMISPGSKTPLKVKIQNAVANCGNKFAAIGQLNAFINQVNSKRVGSELTFSEADQLITLAQDLINSIQNGTAGC